MPDPRTFTVAQELRFFEELQRINDRNDYFRQTMTPQLARNVGELFTNAPYAPKEVVFTAGRALTDNRITQTDANDIVTSAQTKVLKSPITYEIPKPSTWDKVFGGIKSTAKWGLAGLSFTSDIAENFGGAALSSAYGAVATTERYANTGTTPFDVLQTPEQYRGNATFAVPTDLATQTIFRGAQITPGDITPDLGTVIRSTSLGALLTGADSGNGWFVGDEALRIQNQARSRWAGTVNGVPMTPGRGLALPITRPGTAPYNILASLVDIGTQIAIPAAPGFTAARGKIFTGLADVDIAPILRTVGTAQPGEVRPLIRSMAGLTDFETPFIVRDKVNEFLDTTMGRYVQQRLANVTDYEKAAELFPNSTLRFRQEIVNSTEDTIREVLEREMGIGRGTYNIRDIDITRLDDVKRGLLNNGFSRWSGLERLFSARAGNEIALVTDDAEAMTRGVDNLSNYLVALRVDPARRTELVNKLARTLVERPEDFRTTANEIQEEVLSQIATQRNIPREILDEMFTRYTEFKDDYILFGQVGASSGGAPIPMMFGLGDSRQARQLGKAGKGVMKGTTKDGAEGFYLIPDGTAMLSSEMRRVGLFLPDPDRVYRATSPFRWVVEKKGQMKNPDNWGRKNILVLSMDVAQNKIWKLWTTMTGGFITRNLTESMFRSSMAPGIKSGPLHPVEWITTAIHTNGFGKYLGDIEGIPFTEYARGIGQKEYAEFTDAVYAGLRENFNEGLAQRRAMQTGAWQIVVRSQTDLYPQMVMDNVHLLSMDEIYRMVAQGLNDDRIVEILRAGAGDLGSPVRSLQARHSNVELFNVERQMRERARIEYINEAGEINEENIRKLLTLYVRPRLDYVTRADARLRDVVANGDRLGEFVMGNRNVRAFTTATSNASGELVALDYSDEFKQLVKEIINDPTRANKLPQVGKARINAPARGLERTAESLTQRLDQTASAFFTPLFTKPDAFLNRSAPWRKYYYMKINDLLDELMPGEAAAVRDAALYGKAWNTKEDLRKLLNVRADADGLYQVGANKITVGEYLGQIDKYLKRLDYDDAARANTQARLSNVITNEPNNVRRVANQIAEEAFVSVRGDDKFGARWVGSEDLWKKIVDKAEGRTPSDGAFTAAEIGMAARAFALDETKRVFFNAANTNNVGEVFRIISPFGRAWAEFIRNTTRTLAGNPEKIKNAAVTADGLRGYFYNDPVTGEPYFNYGPLDVMLPIFLGVATAGIGAAGAAALGATGAVGGAAAGGFLAGAGAGIAASQGLEVDARLTAPLKSVSMSFNVLPSVGPIVQVAANALLPDKPMWDDVRQFIAPYGAPGGISDVFPSWLRKVGEAITADPETDRIYGSLTMDAFYALMASGKYDRLVPDDVSRAWDKAKSIGRVLTIARGVGQFIGPGRPGVELVIPTEYKDTELNIGDIKQLVENGDLTNVTLTRIFRILQNRDIDTAVPKFIEMVGENAIYFMVGRTKTAEGVGGLSASKEFGDWERDNQSFADTHKNVYGFFAPIGDGFDKQAFIRQVTSGRRVRRTDPFAAVEDAEYIAGSALYRQYQNELSKDGELTTTDKNNLKTYRADLEEYFPGYAERQQVTNRTETMIKDVIAAANDPRVAENDIAQSVQAYQAWRDWAVESAQLRRTSQGKQPAMSNILSGQANADLRLQLRVIGEQIIADNPAFARVYDDVFYYEIDEV
jgi:hypothetical protein